MAGVKPEVPKHIKTWYEKSERVEDIVSEHDEDLSAIFQAGRDGLVGVLKGNEKDPEKQKKISARHIKSEHLSNNLFKEHFIANAKKKAAELYKKRSFIDKTGGDDLDKDHMNESMSAHYTTLNDLDWHDFYDSFMESIGNKKRGFTASNFVQTLKGRDSYKIFVAAKDAWKGSHLNSSHIESILKYTGADKFIKDKSPIQKVSQITQLLDIYKSGNNKPLNGDDTVIRQYLIQQGIMSGHKDYDKMKKEGQESSDKITKMYAPPPIKKAA